MILDYNLRETKTKQSYTISCSTQFRASAMALAERRGVNVGDIARSILLTLPKEVIERLDDPGEPMAGDREEITLKSGSSPGKTWRRKPRLQVRLPPGYGVRTIRRALGLALALELGTKIVTIETAEEPSTRECLKAARDEVLRLRAIIEALAFSPLRSGVKSCRDALYVLGFSHEDTPDVGAIKARFRMLATIHHPDSRFGDHRRMSQLNEAINCLRNGLS